MSNTEPHCLTCGCVTEELCNASGCSCFNCYPGGHLDTVKKLKEGMIVRVYLRKSGWKLVPDNLFLEGKVVKILDYGHAELSATRLCTAEWKPNNYMTWEPGDTYFVPVKVGKDMEVVDQ